MPKYMLLFSREGQLLELEGVSGGPFGDVEAGTMHVYDVPESQVPQFEMLAGQHPAVTRISRMHGKVQERPP